MAISNYSELQTSVANWLTRDDLTAKIPDFISLAESYISDDLRVRSMITEATITPSQADNYVSLPTGFKEAVTFTDDQGEGLEQLYHEDLIEMQHNATASRPEYYSVTNRINFERLADASYNFTMSYYKALDIATDTTNDVLTSYPNIYLYGTLIQAEPYLKNEKRVNTWVQLYENAIQAANERSSQSLKKLRTDHPAISGGFDITRGY